MLLNKYYCNDEHGGVDNDEDNVDNDEDNDDNDEDNDDTDEDNDDNDEDATDHYIDLEISVQDMEQQLLLELRDPVGTMAVHRQLVEVRY